MSENEETSPTKGTRKRRRTRVDYSDYTELDVIEEEEMDDGVKGMGRKKKVPDGRKNAEEVPPTPRKSGRLSTTVTPAKEGKTSLRKSGRFSTPSKSARNANEEMDKMTPMKGSVTPSRTTPSKRGRPPKTPQSERKGERTSGKWSATPKKTPTQRVPNTPYGLRSRIKSQLIQRACPEEESESSAESCSSSSSDGSDVEGVEELDVINETGGEVVAVAATSSSSSSSFARLEVQPCPDVLDPENYFLNVGKRPTSDNKLTLPDARDILKEGASGKHERELARMEREHRSSFQKWMFYLKEGYNLLLYGLGSKFDLLHAFREDALVGRKTLVVNGFFPSVAVKDVTDALMKDLYGSSCVGGGGDAIATIDALTRKEHCFLLIHNVDGFRERKQRDSLAKLASLKGVRTVATVDHINAPLLRGNASLGGNFLWVDATTMKPYVWEISFENSFLMEGGGDSGLTMAALTDVYESLNGRAQKILRILIERHLEDGKGGGGNAKGKGMTFEDLYEEARREFLVTSDLILRTQLTEFIDHKVVRWCDEKTLTVPVKGELLREFYEKRVLKNGPDD